MEAVAAAAAAAREPDEGEVLTTQRRREGAAGVSLGNDSPEREEGLFWGTPALGFTCPFHLFVQIKPSLVAS